MKRALVSVFLVALALALASCSGPTVALSIGFPSQEAFLVTTAIDIDVVPIASPANCAALVNEAIHGTDVMPSSSALGLVPCDVRAGMSLPDPGTGLHAYIVLGRATNGVILAGCTVADVYPGGPAVDVDLFPTITSDYQTAVTAAHLAPGSTADQRCGGGT